MAEVVLIAAVAEANRVIGDGLDLPWRIPADLRRFKRLTLGHPVVMGRRTFESLLHQFGGPLKDRDNVVLTRHPLHVDHANVHIYSSLDAALGAFADRERVFLGGGASVYEAGLPLADRLELTLVEGAFSGDTVFPPYEHMTEGPEASFERVACERHAADGDVPAFRFETYRRRPV
ncbi:MAG: dihydrofolate reductase [Rubricoccaceae bacterium]|nr:dihydrofolate reductase [Rubricoccaceae bacterium]